MCKWHYNWDTNRLDPCTPHFSRAGRFHCGAGYQTCGRLSKSACHCHPKPLRVCGLAAGSIADEHQRASLSGPPTVVGFTVYALTVAPGGVKNLKPSSANAAADDATDAEPEPIKPGPVALDKDGCPAIPPGTHGAPGSMGVNNCSTFRQYSMSDLAKFLQMAIAVDDGSYFGPQASQAHIVDRTGFSGEFDFTLRLAFNPHLPGTSPVSAPDTPDLFAALEKQLGLKLKEGKSRLNVLAIDHVAKIPTGN